MHPSGLQQFTGELWEASRAASSGVLPAEASLQVFISPLLTGPAVWKLKHSPHLQGNTTFPITGTTWTLKGSINSSSESSRANTDPVAFLNERIIYFLQAKASNQLLAS